jgi:hypothetical protein
VWSDVVCPWCAIGKKRLEDALAKRTGERTGNSRRDADLDVLVRSAFVRRVARSLLTVARPARRQAGSVARRAGYVATYLG